LAILIKNAGNEMTDFEYEVPMPGQFIQEELDARGWSQRDLAFILGVEETALNKIIKGKTGISLEMSKALATAFEVDDDLFANLQKTFDLAHTPASDPAIARRASMQREYPIREMIKRGWLQNMEVSLLEIQLERFLKDAAQPHAARKTNSGEEPTPTQLAWLSRVIQIAETMECGPYSERELSRARTNLKALMRHPEDTSKVPPLLARCGVRFVIVEGLPNAKIDGVCVWLDSETPAIGMSLRFDRIDNFWYVLWHEISHVLNRHGNEKGRNWIIDVDLAEDRTWDSALRSEQEKVADRQAAENCVPTYEMDTFVRQRTIFADRVVVAFAQEMHVHPGIVVGQIHNRTKRWDLLRKHLVKVRQYLMDTATIDGWGSIAPISV
jgi:HTH-type transcriptional regulator/antitoxin HigA